jgi:hypothetical protein
MVEFTWAGQLKKGSNKETGLALSKSKLAKTIFGKLFGFKHFCFENSFLITVFLSCFSFLHTFRSNFLLKQRL